MAYFGGKSTVVDLIWERLGDTTNFVDPFFGSNIILLSRPHWNAETGRFDGDKPWRTETVNDANGFVSNFWRAVQHDPEAVGHYADWPVSECDLHARHLWLLRQATPDFVERLMTDPAYYDAKIAGWWVWGACQWIGSGWCDLDRYGNNGMGIHVPSRQRPNLRPWQGVEVERRPVRQLPHLGDNGRGIHAPSRKLPHLGNNGRGIIDLMHQLAARLRNVRVTCGDWSRVLGPSPTFKVGTCGIVLDPPYDPNERKGNLYAVDDSGNGVPISTQVRHWCIEEITDGDYTGPRGCHPKLRIALFGYTGEGHEILEGMGWDCVPWQANGGYSNQSTKGNDNRSRERIWFSPACLRPEQELQLSLFDYVGQSV